MNDQGNSAYTSFNFMKSGLLPQEETLEIGMQKKKLVIGIPKEMVECEYRVPLTPEAVEILVNLGHDIFIETGAGENAKYLDYNYSEKGGIIVNSNAEVFKADIILKVSPLSLSEIHKLKERSLVISSLSLSTQNDKYFKGLIEKKTTALAFEDVKDEFGFYPVVQSMSAIAGIASIIIAGEYLSTPLGGKGVLLGGIPGITPTEIVFLGSDVATEYAIRSAIGMGSSVKVFDHSVQALKHLQDRIGQPLHSSIFHPRVLMKALKSADVVIGTLFQDAHQPYLITEEMVKQMKEGSIIIDLTMGLGRCIETSKTTTHKDPSYISHGVIHYCVPNMPGRVSRTASIALSNVLLPILLKMGEMGNLKWQVKEDQGFRHGIYMYNGILTNPKIGDFFKLPSKDLDLLLAAF